MSEAKVVHTVLSQPFQACLHMEGGGRGGSRIDGRGVLRLFKTILRAKFLYHAHF